MAEKDDEVKEIFRAMFKALKKAYLRGYDQGWGDRVVDIGLVHHYGEGLPGSTKI